MHIVRLWLGSGIGGKHFQEHSGISRTNTVKVRPHPGEITVDICDYIKPELCHKPDVM